MSLSWCGRVRWTPLSLDTRSLALMRVVMGFGTLYDLFDRMLDLEAHYTDAGVMPRALVVNSLGLPWWSSIHMYSGMWFCTLLLFVVHGAVGAALLVGFYSKTMCLLNFLLTMSLHVRAPLVLHSGDVLFRCLLLFASLLPIGDVYSVDSALSSHRGEAKNRIYIHTSIASALFVSQIALMYYFSVLWKDGDDWTKTYDATFFAISLLSLRTRLAEAVLAVAPRDLLRLLTFLVIRWETYAVALIVSPLYNQVTRTVAGVGFFLMHVGFGLFLRLDFFTYAALSMVMALWSPWSWDHLLIPLFNGLRLRLGLTALSARPSPLARLILWMIRLFPCCRSPLPRFTHSSSSVATWATASTSGGVGGGALSWSGKGGQVPVAMVSRGVWSRLLATFCCVPFVRGKGGGGYVHEESGCFSGNNRIATYAVNELESDSVSPHDDGSNDFGAATQSATHTSHVGGVHNGPHLDEDDGDDESQDGSKVGGWDESLDDVCVVWANGGGGNGLALLVEEGGATGGSGLRVVRGVTAVLSVCASLPLALTLGPVLLSRELVSATQSVCNLGARTLERLHRWIWVRPEASQRGRNHRGEWRRGEGTTATTTVSESHRRRRQRWRWKSYSSVYTEEFRRCVFVAREACALVLLLTILYSNVVRLPPPPEARVVVGMGKESPPERWSTSVVATAFNILPTNFLTQVEMLLQLEQAWGMFSPNPPHESFFYSVVVELVDGRFLDAFRGRGLFTKIGVELEEVVTPVNMREALHNHRWVKYGESLSYGQGFTDLNGIRFALGQWTCATWNRVNFDLDAMFHVAWFHHTIHVHRNGTEEILDPELLFEFQCMKSRPLIPGAKVSYYNDQDKYDENGNLVEADSKSGVTINHSGSREDADQDGGARKATPATDKFVKKEDR